MDIISADQQYTHIKVLSFIQLLIKPSNICLVPGNNFIQLSVHPQYYNFYRESFRKGHIYNRAMKEHNQNQTFYFWLIYNQ